MNIPILFRCLAAVLLLFSTPFALVAQQTQYYIQDVVADIDSEVAVEVRGIDIDTIVGVQFSIAWDSTLFDFRRVEAIALDGTFQGNFNSTRTVSGQLGYLEADGTLMGFGLPDSALLFRVILEPLTTVSTTTTISFASAPLRTSVRSSNNNTIEPLMTNGTVVLNGANSLSSVAEDPRLTVAPNPFRAFTQLTVRLAYGGPASLDILDPHGRLLKRQQHQLPAGNNTLTLRGRDFPANGAYIIRLTTAREQLHRKVIMNGR